MAKFLQEITEWKNPAPNHLYVVDDSKSKMIAYRPVGATAFTTFTKPIRYEGRGRKFTEVPNTFGFTVAPVAVPVHPTWSVLGSKGERYTVSKIDNSYSCTCSGYKFRGKCRHANQIANKVI